MYINREKTIKTGVVTVIFLFCIAIVALILNGMNQFKTGSQLSTINQVSNLSHLLVRQQANLFSMLLAKNAPTEELNDALDQFAQEEFVIDANLYAANGVLIAQSSNARPFDPKTPSNISSQQIVEPIFIQQELTGFLRITFDTEYGQTTRSKIDELFHLLYGKLIVLFLCGGLFVSCFYVFRRKTVHIIHSPSTKPSTNNHLAQTKRFHSRRRAFGRK